MFRVNDNNLHKVSYVVKSVTLSALSVLSAKVRLFIRHKHEKDKTASKKNILYDSLYDTNQAVICGIELLFTQNDLTFSTVILLKDFFSHPTLTFKDVILSLINHEVHLFYIPTRLNQYPYFQIAEVLNFEIKDSIFSEVYDSTSGYFAKDLLAWDPKLINFNLQKINPAKPCNVLLNYNSCYVHLSITNHINDQICLQFLDYNNNTNYTGFIGIQDFLLNANENLITFLEHSNNLIYSINTDSTNHGFFYLTDNERFNSGRGGLSIKQLCELKDEGWNLLNELNLQLETWYKDLSKEVTVLLAFIKNRNELDKNELDGHESDGSNQDDSDGSDDNGGSDSGIGGSNDSGNAGSSGSDDSSNSGTSGNPNPNPNPNPTPFPTDPNQINQAQDEISLKNMSSVYESINKAIIKPSTKIAHKTPETPINKHQSDTLIPKQSDNKLHTFIHHHTDTFKQIKAELQEQKQQAQQNISLKTPIDDFAPKISNNKNITTSLTRKQRINYLQAQLQQEVKTPIARANPVNLTTTQSTPSTLPKFELSADSDVSEVTSIIQKVVPVNQTYTYNTNPDSATSSLNNDADPADLMLKTNHINMLKFANELINYDVREESDDDHWIWQRLMRRFDHFQQTYKNQQNKDDLSGQLVELQEYIIYHHDNYTSDWPQKKNLIQKSLLQSLNVLNENSRVDPQKLLQTWQNLSETDRKVLSKVLNELHEEGMINIDETQLNKQERQAWENDGNKLTFLQKILKINNK